MDKVSDEQLKEHLKEQSKGQAEDQFSRTRMLLGESALSRLKAARVAIFGIGGVGGYVMEALARSGVGALDLIDSDTVSVSNLNRQIVALHSTIGRLKVDVGAERVRDINPDCKVSTQSVFFTPQTSAAFDFAQYDYVVDCIDTVSGKIELVLCAQRVGVPVISSMGAGNKMNPAMFEVADIYETSVCPLARVMRRELRARGVQSLKVVYSKEPPIDLVDGENRSARNAARNAENCAPKEAASPDEDSSPKEAASPDENCAVQKKRTPGSNAFVPSVAGLIIAGEVVRYLAGYAA